MDGNQSLVDRIKNDVLKTGFPTEVLTAVTLSQRKWYCVLGPSYLDDMQQVSREFDVRAYKQLQSAQGENPLTLGIYLLIECKKSEKPWVFFTAPPDIEKDLNPRYGKFLHAKSLKNVQLFDDHWSGITPIIPHHEWLSFHHYATHPRWGHNYYEPFKNQEKVDKSIQIHTAIHSVVNATRFYVKQSGESERWTALYYPLIVFDGELFEARVASKNEIEIIPSDHIVLKHHTRSNSKFSSEGVDGRIALIDVIRASYLEKYCEQIEREQYLLYERLSIADREGRLTPSNRKVEP